MSVTLSGMVIKSKHCDCDCDEQTDTGYGAGLAERRPRWSWGLLEINVCVCVVRVCVGARSRLRKSDDSSQTCASEHSASRQSVRDVRCMQSEFFQQHGSVLDVSMSHGTLAGRVGHLVTRVRSGSAGEV